MIPFLLGFGFVVFVYFMVMSAIVLNEIETEQNRCKKHEWLGINGKTTCVRCGYVPGENQ